MNPSPPRLHSWSLSVRAKSRGFDLKLNASNVFPNLGKGGEKISLLLRLRLRRFLFLEVKSENQDPAKRDSPLILRLFRSVDKFLRRKQRLSDAHKRSRPRNHNHRIGSQHRNGSYFPNQGHMAAIAGSLSLISHSGSEKNHERIILHALSFVFYLIFLFKMRNTNNYLLLVAIAISFTGCSLSCLSYTYTGLVTKAVWKAWNNVISIGCFSVLSQVTFSRISLLVQRNLIVWLIILAFILSLLHELSRERFFRCMQCAVEGAPLVISILLLPCQAFFHTVSLRETLSSICDFSPFYLQLEFKSLDLVYACGLSSKLLFEYRFRVELQYSWEEVDINPFNAKFHESHLAEVFNLLTQTNLLFHGSSVISRTLEYWDFTYLQHTFGGRS